MFAFLKKIFDFHSIGVLRKVSIRNWDIHIFLSSATVPRVKRDWMIPLEQSTGISVSVEKYLILHLLRHTYDTQLKTILFDRAVIGHFYLSFAPSQSPRFEARQWQS